MKAQPLNATAVRERLIQEGKLPECGSECGIPHVGGRVHVHNQECVYYDPGSKGYPSITSEKR